MGREPNTRLADLFGLAGWSKGELARLVNRQAAAMGHPQLATDTSRVRRWIDMGETPRDPVPKVLASLFTERLGRVVTTEDLGFARSGRTGRRQSDDGLPWAPERTAAVLTEFTGMDLMLNRRGLVGAGAALAAGSALTGAMDNWLHTDPAPRSGAAAQPDPHPLTASGFDSSHHYDQTGLDRYEAAPVGSQEIDALERSVEVFRAWDASRGGGLQRKAVVGQLNEVGGMLAYHHPEHLQRRLWGVAANLAVLAGWMSHDVGLEPTAQKYFVIAAHAAREGGDRPRAGEALSRAARQMVHLGRPDDALDLMQLASSGSGEQALPRTRAMLRTIEAWAHAAKGNGHAVRHTLGEAEELFVSDKGDVPPPSWMQMFDEADLHGMEALTYRTLAEHDPSVAALAQCHAKQALQLRENGRRRAQIFDYLSMASACFIGDDPEQADRYARLALAAIGENSSHRTWDRLREMYRLAGQYANNGRIKELRAEIDEVMPKPRGKAKVPAPATALDARLGTNFSV
ncbi:DNA-binding protein NsdB [Streptomyces sp. NPDC002067]